MIQISAVQNPQQIAPKIDYVDKNYIDKDEGTFLVEITDLDAGMREDECVV